MARGTQPSDRHASPERQAGGDRTEKDPVRSEGTEDDLLPLNEEGDEDLDYDMNSDFARSNESTHLANARNGLNIRSGPGVEFPVIRSLPHGTHVNLLKREGRWGLIDERGDGAADGFVHLAFLDDRASGGFNPVRHVLADEMSAFWAQRNPRLAKLYDRTGNALVDPRLLRASAVGATAFEAENPTYRIEMYGPGGGFRTSGSVANHGAQPDTGRGGAMDFVVIDRRTNNMLTNHPGQNHQHRGSVGENAPIYQSYFNEVVRAGSKLFQGFEKMARFGGYFANGENAMDTMHIDLRGLVAPMGGGSLNGGFTERQMTKWNIPQNYPYR